MTSLFTRLILAVDSIKLQNVKIYPKHPPKLCLITAYISLLIRIHEMALIFQCAEENWTWQDQLNGIVADPRVRTKVSTITCCKSMFVAPFIKASTTLTCVRCSNQDRGKHKSDGHQNVLYARLFLGGGHTKIYDLAVGVLIFVSTHVQSSLFYSHSNEMSVCRVWILLHYEYTEISTAKGFILRLKSRVFNDVLAPCCRSPPVKFVPWQIRGQHRPH